MKKMLAMLLAMTISVFGAYSDGSTITNYSWQDSDGGAATAQTVDGILNSGKLLVVTWGYKG